MSSGVGMPNGMPIGISAGETSSVSDNYKWRPSLAIVEVDPVAVSAVLPLCYLGLCHCLFDAKSIYVPARIPDGWSFVFSGGGIVNHGMILVC